MTSTGIHVASGCYVGCSSGVRRSAGSVGIPASRVSPTNPYGTVYKGAYPTHSSYSVPPIILTCSGFFADATRARCRISAHSRQPRCARMAL
jgi:hypothetical protein